MNFLHFHSSLWVWDSIGLFPITTEAVVQKDTSIYNIPSFTIFGISSELEIRLTVEKPKTRASLVCAEIKTFDVHKTVITKVFENIQYQYYLEDQMRKT